MDSQIVSSKVAELKGIPTLDELNTQLRENVMVVTFNKLDNFPSFKKYLVSFEKQTAPLLSMFVATSYFEYSTW